MPGRYPSRYLLTVTPMVVPTMLTFVPGCRLTVLQPNVVRTGFEPVFFVIVASTVAVPSIRTTCRCASNQFRHLTKIIILRLTKILILRSKLTMRFYELVTVQRTSLLILTPMLIFVLTNLISHNQCSYEDCCDE